MDKAARDRPGCSECAMDARKQREHTQGAWCKAQKGGGERAHKANEDGMQRVNKRRMAHSAHGRQGEHKRRKVHMEGREHIRRMAQGAASVRCK